MDYETEIWKGGKVGSNLSRTEEVALIWIYGAANVISFNSLVILLFTNCSYKMYHTSVYWYHFHSQSIVGTYFSN